MSFAREFFGGFIQGFRHFGHSVSSIVNYALLSFVYFFGVGMTSLFARAVGKHFLDLKTDNEKKSCWIDHKVTKQSIEEYYKQF